MIRRPPRSTLFPTRRSSDLYANKVLFPLPLGHPSDIATVTEVRHQLADSALMLNFRYRSEEHTSELQSRENLVCRLLLEKKKKKTKLNKKNQQKQTTKRVN